MDFGSGLPGAERPVNRIEDGEDGRSWFGLGIASEMKGDYDEAINAYRQAATCEGVDEEETAMYQSAADRLRGKGQTLRKAIKL